MNADLDHIVMIAADLEVASRKFASLTGVEPVYGGVHSTGVTHNALVGLSNKQNGRQYLEILAPAKSDAAGDNAWAGLARTASELRVLTYCLRVDVPLEELAAWGARQGWKNTQVIPGERLRPDGVLLRWQLCIPEVEPYGFAFPFFIDWLDSPHPADTLRGASGAFPLQLIEFVPGHPQSSGLKQLLHRLGCPLDVSPAPEFRLRLQTPRGPVTFPERSIR